MNDDPESKARTARSNWARLAPWAVGAVAAINGFATAGRVSDWNTTHWLFDYHLEFVRRGLVGSIVAAASEPSVEQIRQLAVGALVLSSAALVWFTTSSLRRRPDAFATGLAILTVACPATLTQLGFDCGRFDQIDLILFLAALVVIERGASAAPLVVASLTVVALLVHEAFLVVHVPVLIAVMAHRSDRSERRVDWGVVLVAAVALVVGGLVLRFGSLEAVDHETYRDALISQHALREKDVYYSTRVLYRELHENIALATRTLPRRIFRWEALVVAAVLAPWLWAAIAALRSLRSKIEPARRFGFWLPVIASASPLLLAVVGSDLFRWCSLSLLNLFVVTLLLIRTNPEAEFALRPGRGWIGLLVVVSWIVGPVGIDTPLPRF